MDIIELGNILKTARENKKMTQAEVAQKAGLGTNYYAVIERGEKNISFKKINKVLEVLGIKVTLP